jgi:hypothetical protein
MISKHSSPTTEQKKYWTDIVDIGCVLCGGGAEIDHVYGAKAIHNKVAIGNWAVVALCPSHHRLERDSRTISETSFFKRHMPTGDYEYLQQARRWLIIKQHRAYLVKYKRNLPVPEDVIKAIFKCNKLKNSK